MGAASLRALTDFTAASAGEEGYYVHPGNINHMGGHLTYFKARRDDSFTYGRPIMSLFGIKRGDFSALVRIDRNYKYKFETRVTRGIYTMTVLFDFKLEDAVYDDIRMEVVLLPAGSGYTQMALAERRIRMERGEISTLAEKCRRAPVEYSRKYPLLRIRMGWKPSPSPIGHQNEANEPDMLVACDFARVRDIADELKRQGVEGADLQLVGWNISGHDGRFPQLFPADPRLGGDEGLRKTIDHVKALGYRISLHTNLIDAYEIADSYDWNDIVVLPNGSYKYKTPFKPLGGGYAYHVCLEKQLKNNRRDLPAVAALGLNGVHFTDVISIVEPDACLSTDHPVSTKHAIELAEQIMDESRELMGAFSSEGTMDFAVGHIDSGLYVTFGDGFGVRREGALCDRTLPLFELTYHGFLIYNPMSPTVNYTVKGSRERLLTYMRGGRPAFYIYSRFRTGGNANWMGEVDLETDTDEALRDSVAAIKRGLDEYQSSGADDRQLVFMSDYLLPEGGLEVAVYEDGTRIVGNFGDAPAEFEGRTVAPGEYEIIK